MYSDFSSWSRIVWSLPDGLTVKWKSKYQSLGGDVCDVGGIGLLLQLASAAFWRSLFPVKQRCRFFSGSVLLTR